MSKVMIDKARLDTLAEKISIKSKIQLPLTITGMINAIQSIHTKDEIKLQNKVIVPTVSYQTITPDEDYDGLSKIQLKINIRHANSLFAAGPDVYVPSGYYDTQVSKSVQTMSLPTSYSSYASGALKATITPSSIAYDYKYINIPIGYNTTTSYYRIAPLPCKTDMVTNVTMNSNRTKLTVSNLKGKPQSFSLRCLAPLSVNSTSIAYHIVALTSNGSYVRGTVHYQTSGQLKNQSNGYTVTYANNTITLSSSGTLTTTPTGGFYPGSYEFIYTYQ